MQPLCEKYRPKKLSDIKGQDEAVRKALFFVQNYKQQKKKALLLYGPRGSGKTSLAIALAGQTGSELVEFNASDARNKKIIDETLKNTVSQMSLFARQKIILFDEVDGLSGTKDRGGIQALIDIMKKSPYPIILTANDVWSKKLSSVRRYCLLAELKSLSAKTVLEVLNNVCEIEGIPFEKEALNALARRSGGDLRGCLVDLQTLSSGVTTSSLQAVFYRRQAQSVFDALRRILKGRDAFLARGSIDDIDEDIDSLMLWIKDNMPLEYSDPDDRLRAFDFLSRADVFKGRIMRYQHWRFLVYVIDLMTAGVCIAKKKKYKGFVQYKKPDSLLTMWKAKQSYARRESIIDKIPVHASRKSIRQDLCFLARILLDDNFADLSPDELEWLSKKFS